MQPLEIRPQVYSVGALDWDLEEMHGYTTPRGVTYNAYLIIDEHPTLIDAVKYYELDELLHRIEQVLPLDKLEYLVVNHAEPDHASALPELMRRLPHLKLFCTKRGEDSLRGNYHADWALNFVDENTTLSLGKRHLVFRPVPMLHWPESMVTYCPEEKILFSNDAFGQHLATAARYDDEIGWEIIEQEAAKYYANIVLPFGAQVKGALEALSGLQIDLIAPSHGVMLRGHIKEMLAAYAAWADYQAEPNVAVIFYTMWDSTRKLACAIAEGAQAAGVKATLRNLEAYHYSDAMTDVLLNRAVAVGSPTLNNGLHPAISAFMTYMTGLRPRKRVGLAFGSYGWGGQAPGLLHQALEQLKWELPLEALRVKWRPTAEDLKTAFEAGKALAEAAKAFEG